MITLAMFMLFGWFISHYAKNKVPRLIWSGIGMYFIFNSYILSPLAFLGLGLLLPHFRFLYIWVHEVIATLKLATHNTYYFFLTVYFKIRYYVMWFVYIYFEIKSFFSNIKNKNAYEKYYKNKGYKYEEPKRESNYKQQNKQSSSSTSSSKKTHAPEHEQFYSKDNYVVLGVSRSDDYKTIKIAYRKLIRKYHTDVNQDKSPETLKLYNEISQLINNAWDIVEQEKK